MLVVWLVAATGSGVLANDPPGWDFWGAWFLKIRADFKRGADSGHWAAERRMYLPLLNLVTLTVIAAWNGLSALSRRFKLTATTLGWAFFAFIAGASASRTTQRNHDYHSEIAIWTDTMRQLSYNGRAWTNLGFIGTLKAGTIPTRSLSVFSGWLHRFSGGTRRHVPWLTLV